MTWRTDMAENPKCPKCGKAAESVSATLAIHKSHMHSMGGISFRVIDKCCVLGRTKP